MAPDRHTALDYIAGPIAGFYLAAYAVPSPDGYIGYAKVCIGKPESTWDSTPAIRKLAAGPFPTEFSAIAMVLKKAECELAGAGDSQVLWEEAASPLSGG